ncbi:MAG: hypothetical protein V1925_03005 [Candidatus Omnitrophota bacterium]
MLNKNAGQVSLTVFALIAVILFFQADLTAQEEAKAGAMDEALASQEAAQPQSLPPQVPEEEVPEFRKKLKLAISEKESIEEEDLTPFTYESYARYLPSRKVSAQSGKVELIDTMSEYSYEYKLFGRLPLEFSFQHEYISVNNSTVVKLPAHLTSFSFGLDATVPFLNLKNTYFRIGVSPGFNTDNWSFYENSFRIPQRYFAIYQPDKKFTAILGFAFFPRYRTAFLPIAGIIYKPNDKWLFNLIPSRPTVEYKFNSKLTAFAEYSGTRADFVVTKDDIKGTVLQYEEQHAGAGLRYNFNKNIMASLAAGGAFFNKLQYRDSLGKVRPDSGFYTEFRMEIDL